MDKGSVLVGEQNIVHAMAVQLDTVVAGFLGGKIDVTLVGGALASLYSTYLVNIKPTERVLAVSDLVDAIFAGINSDPDRDLITQH